MTETAVTGISLCSGAFGLDLGFLAHGGQIRVAVDTSKHSDAVAKVNLPRVPFLREDITEISTKKLLEKADLEVGEPTFVFGGPPCQPFTILGKRTGLGDPRSDPLREFFRIVKESRPKYFLMEEVAGVKQNGDTWRYVLDQIRDIGYHTRWKVVQAADYGVPQKRRRLIIIGRRDASAPQFPIPTHTAHPAQSRLFGAPRKKWISLREAIGDIQGSEMSWCPLPPEALEALPFVPEGGNWRDLPRDRVERLMGPAFHSNGGKSGFFRRLAWDRPSHTILTRPVHKMTFLGHPSELRPLSVEECKRIQTFPDDWELPVSQSARYSLIGNAVPPLLARQLFAAFDCW
jgi:DNA (cytosine-5)-methyltransferase 1